MTVYDLAYAELLLSGKIGLKPGTHPSTYYRYAQRINEMCIWNGIGARCVADPKRETLYLV